MKLAPLLLACALVGLTGCEYVMEMAKGQFSIAERARFDSALVSRLAVAPGFKVEVWAKDSGDPRDLTFAPDGTAYVARRKQADVVLLRPAANGLAGSPEVVAAHIEKANDVALHDGKLYITSASQVLVAPRLPDGRLGARKVLVTGLPKGGRHYTRTLGFGPDGLLYVSVGSSCNACIEDSPERAAILRVQPDGRRSVFASGLRNTIGFDWHPETHALWGMDQGADEHGPDEPGEELNQIVQGGNYGWPFCYGDHQPDLELAARPPGGQSRERYCEGTVAPVLRYQAHSSPLDLVFYTGHQFPQAYQGDAFVTLHGSWDRVPAVGYKVVRVHFEHGQPQRFEDFITGFLASDNHTEFGRPCGLAVAPDGALFFTDDSNGVIYRVSHPPEG